MSAPANYQGADALVHGAIGRWQRRPSQKQRRKRQAERIDALEGQWKDLDEASLRAKLHDCRADCARAGAHLPEDRLLQTLAGLREAASRTVGWRAHLVQLQGVLALNEGHLAEMATGEGKTLVAGLAAALSAFRRRPCHVITVNDYLVRRDAQRMRSFYDCCALRGGSVIAGMPPKERRLVYAQEVTHVTAKEVLADLLRDALARDAEPHASRALIREMRVSTRSPRVLGGPLVAAIVDEADSVLIDEAVTPLIISRPRENTVLTAAAREGAALAEAFMEGVDYRADAARKEIRLTDAGKAKLIERGESMGSLWCAPKRRWELLRSALIARAFFHVDQQYLIEKGKIVIVDEFTGRPMPQRTWRQGLHQAIEAKEDLEITPPNETIARMSFQRFFRSYRYLSGMTGTAREAASELWHIYELPVMRISRHRPEITTRLPLQAFDRAESKWEAIVAAIQEVHASGRPILVGTRSVHASEQLSQRLGSVGLACQVLNAARLAEEALIVAKAGECGRVTIATNMAGRGTDIVLDDEVVPLGGLHVIVAEPHESSRIDRQLMGRAGRQGDPGSAQLFLSFEDELFQKHLSSQERRVLCRRPLATMALRRAQSRAESLAYKQRRQVLKMDDWLDKSLGFAGS